MEHDGPSGADMPEEIEPPDPRVDVELPPRVRRVLLVNYTLIGLAAASAALLILDWTVPLRPAERIVLTWIDRATIVAFGASLAARLVLARDAPGRMKVRGWELLGLLPLTEPLFTGFRFYPVVQVVVVVARMSSGLDRYLGEHAMRRVLDRYSAMIVEEVTDRVLIRGSRVAERIVLKGRYAASVGESLEARREDVHGSVDQALDSNRHLRRVQHIPGVPRIVRGTVDAALDAAVAQLTSEEMDRIVDETIQRTFEDFRTGVAEKEWTQRGLRADEDPRGRGEGHVDGSRRPDA